MRIRTITYGMPKTVARMTGRYPDDWAPEVRPIAWDTTGLLGAVGLGLLVFGANQTVLRSELVNDDHG